MSAAESQPLLLMARRAGSMHAQRAGDDASTESLLSRLDADREHVVARVCDVLTQALPLIATPPPAGWESLDAVVRRAYAMFLRYAAEESLHPEDLVDLRGYGRRAQLRGITADDVAAALDAGVDEMLRHLTDAADVVAGGCPALGTLARRLYAFRQVVVGAFREGHAGLDDALTTLIVDVLRGTCGDDRSAITHGRSFAYDLAASHAMAVVSLRTTAEMEHDVDLRRGLDAMRQSLAGAVVLPGSTLGQVPHVVVITSPSDRARSRGDGARSGALHDAAVALARRSPRAVVLTDAVRSPTAMREVHRSALRLLPVAERLPAVGPGPVYALDELRVTSLLLSAARSEQARFVAETLGPILRLPEPQRGALLTSLRALCLTRSLPDAARRLGVHANTVKYRRDRLEQLCGRAVGGEGQLQLWLALELAVLLGLAEPDQSRPLATGASRR